MKLNEDVIRKFLIAILSDEENGVLRFTKSDSLQHTGVSQVISLLITNSDDIDTWVSAGANAFSIPGPAAMAAAHIAAWAEATLKAKTTERWGESRSHSAMAEENVIGAVRTAAEVLAQKAKSAAGTYLAGIDARLWHYSWMLNELITLVMKGKDE